MRRTIAINQLNGCDSSLKVIMKDEAMAVSEMGRSLVGADKKQEITFAWPIYVHA